MKKSSIREDPEDYWNGRAGIHWSKWHLGWRKRPDDGVESDYDNAKLDRQTLGEEIAGA